MVCLALCCGAVAVVATATTTAAAAAAATATAIAAAAAAFQESRSHQLGSDIERLGDEVDVNECTSVYAGTGSFGVGLKRREEEKKRKGLKFAELRNVKKKEVEVERSQSRIEEENKPVVQQLPPLFLTFSLCLIHVQMRSERKNNTEVKLELLTVEGGPFVRWSDRLVAKRLCQSLHAVCHTMHHSMVYRHDAVCFQLAAGVPNSAVHLSNSALILHRKHLGTCTVFGAAVAELKCSVAIHNPQSSHNKFRNR
ncbi:unnamed protein product [Gongylonema pulchrum]|uniref:Secreted protein n=1 Tax=Gongylonema pulchrum TaxID=637853 RepID=A0A183DWQ8_9BILA|nr:unnamed protein product [Gongylonema pulchrum]